MRHGQPKSGTERGPDALRAAGLVSRISALGRRCVDAGDVADAGGMEATGAGAAPHNTGTASSLDAAALHRLRNASAVGGFNHRLSLATEAAARRGDFVLTVGGDHSVATGTIAGLLRSGRRLGIVWVDAHADINAPATSPSGNIHGMPLSFLGKTFDCAAVPGHSWLTAVPPLGLQRQLVYVGLRDVDEGERRAIKSLGIKAFTMHEVDKHGIGAVMEMALSHLDKQLGGGVGPSDDWALHLSYDIDAVDPGVAPSTGTTVQGGLNYREAHYVAEACAETGRLGSMDMVEINPALGASSTATVALGIELIESALGKAILSV